MAFKTVYEGSFCNKSGDDVIVRFDRDFTGDFEVIPQEIIFAGEDSEPVVIEYTEDGTNKDNPINKSQCTINLKAVEGFELSSLYTENDKYWRIVISGAWNWTGWLLPDNSSEPYQNKPYDVSLQATDALGTLSDIPFQNANLTKIKGSYSDHDILRIALNKTGLPLNMVIGVSTYEAQMTVGTCPLKQSFIKAETFIAADQSSFSCAEVIRSILARYSCRLFQVNGKWQIVNVLEYSRGTVFAWEFDNTGAQVTTYANVVNTLATGKYTRDSVPTNATGSYAKAYGSATAYYQYGYINNSLLNGNMDTWTSKPNGLPDGWSVVQNGGTVTATTGIRQVNGVDTTDYFITVEGQGGGRLVNTYPTQIRANDTASLSFVFYAPTAPPGGSGGAYLSIIIRDNNNNYYTNTGWQNSYAAYQIKYVTKDTDWQSQISVNFKINPQNNDYQIVEVGILPIGTVGGTPTHYPTSINDVNINSGKDSATLQAIGSYNKQVQTAQQTYQPDPVLILNSDDFSDQRNSPILVNGQPTTAWKRAFITESKSLLHTIANTQLRLHSRPYKLFEGDFIGLGEINPNSLITIDLNPGNFIFMSGSFNLRTDIHNLRFAEVLIDDVTYVETQRLDYGQETDNNGVQVGTPQGVSDQPGGAIVDLTGYAKTTDVPAAATNVETQAGTVTNKYVSPSTLANWWSNLKTLAQTITGIWSVPTAATGTNTQQIASTEFVNNAVAAFKGSDVVLSKSANYTVVMTDFGSNGHCTIYANTTSGNVAITLPSAVAMNGYTLNVIKTTSDINSVVVTGTINGVSNDFLSNQYDAGTYKSNGSLLFKF